MLVSSPHTPAGLQHLLDYLAASGVDTLLALRSSCPVVVVGEAELCRAEWEGGAEKWVPTRELAAVSLLP